MTTGLVVLVVLVVLVLVLFFSGFRVLALLLLLALLGLWAYMRLERRAAVQELPSAPVILPSDGGLYPDGHEGSGTILH
jgi:CDP-diglyceride synthetase